jgi:hypothetical protein
MLKVMMISKRTSSVWQASNRLRQSGDKFSSQLDTVNYRSYDHQPTITDGPDGAERVSTAKTEQNDAEEAE